MQYMYVYIYIYICIHILFSIGKRLLRVDYGE